MDFERVKLLLDTILSCNAHGPQFQHIGAAARQELLEMNEAEAAKTRKAPVPQPVPAPTPVTEAPKAIPSTPTVERRA